MQSYSNNYETVIIKTLHVQRKDLSEKDTRRRRKNKTVKIRSSGNIAKIFRKHR